MVSLNGGKYMQSYLLKTIPDELASLAVEGFHKPGSL